MNRIFYFRCFLSVSLATLMFGCKPNAEKKDEKPAEASATKAEAGLKFDAETQARMKLKTEALTESEFAPETKCFGHVIDPSPLNAAMNDITLAKATLNLSQKEFDRLKILREQNNASERAFQTAEAALERDRLTVQGSTEKLQLTWGKEIAGHKDVAELARSLAAGDRSLIRLDFPIQEKPATIPNHLRISSFPNEETHFDADFLGAAPTVDLPTQGQGFLFSANAGNDKLPIGSSVTARLQTGASALKGFLIPSAAVIVHDGEKWFYQQSGDSEFHREAIEGAINTATGYFVTNGVTAGARIVTTGAQQLLSDELKSQIKPD
ncbi:MAG: efflux transporter periplasmic adaptor subunit [Verrucomicrobiales bacterium]|nr:efflux transporter periplasmic adaptor subunit [Verrucomicrobiales bacterium]